MLTAAPRKVLIANALEVQPVSHMLSVLGH